ncbi:ubiquinone/menaquinone biosynthesis C-methylase UbiE [Paenibacillus anaericanus]|uniref:class I SAM-dependent methyltransferase n=1 Tax=Paenibacillus anaericanus TaxID=170367 RepID=UPI0027835EE2|nr:class I SAM-dependent methyltransferase [Paenibacillus anaericanus]MDQ0088543.1 ubiquinone/menaquinone biosynthesis C-methylase UbiE [Paenibacillus anaericanus]
MSILESLIEQSKNPNKRIGKIMLNIMNKAHMSRTKFGLNKLSIKEGYILLDIGCGGGETIREMSKMNTNIRIIGVDYSETSVNLSIERNSKDVQSGKVEIVVGEVSKLPFEDKYFDIITAVQTHYYWPDLKNDVKEVYRVMNTNGKLLIAAEVYKINYHMEGYKTSDEMKELLQSLGFRKVTIEEDGKWRYVIGEK